MELYKRVFRPQTNTNISTDGFKESSATTFSPLYIKTDSRRRHDTAAGKLISIAMEAVSSAHFITRETKTSIQVSPEIILCCSTSSCISAETKTSTGRNGRRHGRIEGTDCSNGSVSNKNAALHLLNSNIVSCFVLIHKLFSIFTFIIAISW